MSQIILEPFGKQHLDLTWRWMNDPRVTDSFARPPKVTKANHRRWFDRLKKDKSQALFAIVTKNARCHVGNVGLKNINLVHRNAEAWVYIGNSSYRGKGIAKKAIQELIAYGFKKLKLRRIQAWMLESNKASFHLFKKCGFREEGKLKDALYHKGSFHNLHLLARVKK